MSIAARVLGVVDNMNANYEYVSRTEPWKHDQGVAAKSGLTAAFATLQCRQATDTARLVWVADEMVDLVAHAAESLPLYTIRAANFPWPNAICVFGKPPFTVTDLWDGDVRDVCAMQWVSDWSWAPADERPIGKHLVASLGVYKGWLEALTGAVLREGSEWTDEPVEYEGESEPAAPLDIARFLCAFWLLVQQKVTVQTPAIPERAARRQWQRRHGEVVPDVTVVTLRRPANVGGEREDPGFVEWSHRWIVDGHWRNQYHPSTGEHTPTWIAPYVKGPDDKPLVVKRKISAWVR